jgi:VIT1/CCC1 family predicted Fe2+/Mn2+ transporter
MARDAIGAHARDELGISAIVTARPIQATLTSASAFSVGAAMPLLTVLVAPESGSYQRGTIGANRVRIKFSFGLLRGAGFKGRRC